MSYEDGKVKMEGTLDTYKGNLTINILEVLENLSEEQKTELISDGGWWSFIEKSMAEKIVEEFSRESYNEEYTTLRGLIINSESMPSVIREWAVSLIESRERAKQKEEYWNNAYWNLRHWVYETYRQDWDTTPFNAPALPDHRYDRKYSEEFMKEVEENVKKWKDLFPEKVEE